MIKIAGTVVWYNPTKENVENIYSYVDNVDVLYIIDNSNNDNSSLIPNNKKIKYYPNYSNLGISYALNKAAKIALNDKYDFLLTMDQDSKFENSEIAKLIKYANECDIEKVAIVSPKHKINVETKSSSNQVDNPLEVMTSGNLLNLKLYVKIGEFNEDYFIDDVDIEYGLRLNKLGYRIDRLNNCELKHNLGNIKTKKFLNHNFVCSNHNSTRRYYMVRNTLYLCDQYCDIYPDYCDFMKRGLLGQVQNIVLFEKNKTEKIKSMIDGYKSYKTGKIGKMNENYKKKSNWLFTVIMFVLFFSCSVVITWDSAHYLSYVNILNGTAPLSSWDIVRGPVFPTIIFLTNKLFGKNVQGILLIQFINFIILFFVLDYFINKFIVNNKKKKMLVRIIECFLLFNPIVFGYYHVLLTEFVSITLTMLSLMLAYFWFNTDSRKNRVICSLYFFIAVPFSYYLKQPYICCTFIPFACALFISLIKKFEYKKIVDFLLTILFITISIFVSSKLWDNYLQKNGVNMNTGRDTSSIFAKQLLNGVSNYYIDYEYDIENYENDKLLSTKEKEIIKNIKNKENILIINFVNNNSIIEKDFILKDNNGNVSSKDALILIAKSFFQHPILISKNYIKNYCALSSLCNIASDEDGVMYYVDKGYNFINTYENEKIAGRVFMEGDNTFYLSDDLVNNASFYKEYITSTPLTLFENIMKIPTNIIFKFVIITIPIFLLSLIFVAIFNFNKMNSFEKRNFYVILLLLLTSFLGVMANAISGSMIDRYSVEFFVPSFIAEIMVLYYFKIFFFNKKSK